MRDERGAAAAPDRLPPRRIARPPSIDFGRLCVAICHDLRGPVTTAGAAVHGLAASLPAADLERRRWLDIARESLARADELLLSLPLLVARDDEVRREPVALDEVLARASADVAAELALAGGRLTVRAPLAVVSADRERLRIALRNLLRNAIQHRRPAGALEIGVRSWRRGPAATLALSDNGTGLPAGERARLRGPLRPGVSRRGGLGLAIARAAVEACGGRLAAVSRSGVGTTFAITLPGAVGRRSGRGRAAARPAGEATLKQRRGDAPPTPP